MENGAVPDTRATTIAEVERKLATVLFVDLVSSTELVSGDDPEVVRRRVSRFFDQVSHCIVTHGGTMRALRGQVSDGAQHPIANCGVIELHFRDDRLTAPIG